MLANFVERHMNNDRGVLFQDFRTAVTLDRIDTPSPAPLQHNHNSARTLTIPDLLLPCMYHGALKIVSTVVLVLDFSRYVGVDTEPSPNFRRRVFQVPDAPAK